MPSLNDVVYAVFRAAEFDSRENDNDVRRLTASITGSLSAKTIFGKTAAYFFGSIRVSPGGSRASATDVRIVIKSLPDFFGKLKVPLKSRARFQQNRVARFGLVKRRLKIAARPHVNRISRSFERRFAWIISEKIDAESSQRQDKNNQ